MWNMSFVSNSCCNHSRRESVMAVVFLHCPSQRLAINHNIVGGTVMSFFSMAFQLKFLFFVFSATVAISAHATPQFIFHLIQTKSLLLLLVM
uniref:Uncharacterized protein n=1 Tax=Myripristis murdjan TaxID=586833 RepID=A0A667WW67_9TELE